MIIEFLTYYNESFKPKRLAERETARSEILKKKRGKMQLFLKEHESKIKEIEADFSLDYVTSEHLEALTEFIDNENKMLDFFIGDLEGDDVNPNVAFMLEERPLIYVMYQALKDNIKVGEFFDYKEEAQLEEYLRQNLNRSYKYAYNAYPGGDGTAVILSKVELKNSEEAIDEEQLKESFQPRRKLETIIKIAKKRYRIVQSAVSKASPKLHEYLVSKLGSNYRGGGQSDDDLIYRAVLASNKLSQKVIKGDIVDEHEYGVIVYAEDSAYVFVKGSLT